MKNAELFKRNYGVRICLFVLAMMLFVGSAGAQTPNLSGETNLAQGKTATAGYTEAGHSEDMAVDGNLNTNWSGNVSGHLNDNYWQVDLSSSVTFNTIRIQYNNQAPREAKLQYSDDGSTWTDIMTVGSNSDNAADNQTFVYEFTAVTAQYVRIQCVTGGTYGMGFNEFEVYNSTYSFAAISVSPQFVKKQAANNINVRGYDQYGCAYYNYTFSAAGVGAILNSGTPDSSPFATTLTTGAIDNENLITFTATDKTDNTKITTYKVYAIGVGFPSPGIPHDDYIPVYSNGSKEYNATVVWEGAYGRKSLPQTGDIVLPDGQIVKHIAECGQLYIGNTKSPFAGWTPDFKPQDNNVKYLKMKIFCPDAVNGYVSFENSGLADQNFTTIAGAWQELSFDVSGVTGENKLHTITLFLDKNASGVYPDILVSNVYFTKNSTDNVSPSFETDYPSVSATTTTITLKLKATDNGTDADDLRYVITNTSIPTVNIKGSELTGEDMEYTFTGLNAESDYGTFTVTVYDEMGNSASATTESVTTEPLTLETFSVSPAILSIPKGGSSEPLTITALAEDGTDLSNNPDFSVTMSFIEGTGTDVATYDATNKQIVAKSGVSEGHAEYNLTATYHNGISKIAHIELFVYETDLKIQYKLNESDDYSVEHTGKIGKLEELVNSSITSDGKSGTYQNVYSLKVVGNINDADIKTLRHMAGGTDNATSDASLGNLHVLDLASVKFAADLRYAGNLPDDASEDAKTAQDSLREANCFVTAADTVYTTNLVANGTTTGHYFITTGGYSVYDLDVNISETTSDQGETLFVDDVARSQVGLKGFEILPSHIFDHCINLTTIVLPADIKQFGVGCFNECKNLTSVTNYSNVLDFGTNAFAGSGLTTFNLSAASSDLRIVGTGMFMYCENLESVTMPSAIKYISGNAFAFCPKFNLSDGALPTDLQRIGQYAFFTKGKKNISKVVFGGNLKSIDGFAFDTFEGAGGSDTPMIVDFSSATSLEFIGMRAFSDNKKMTMLPADGTLPNSIKSIETYAFAGTAIVNAKLPVNPYYQTVKYGSFGWNNALTSVTIPANVKYIRDVAFVTDNNMRVTLLDKTKLTTIGVSSFDGCSSLTDDFVGVDHVISIGNKGFAACTNLTDQSGIDLMSHLTRINDETFASCTSLTKVILPASITEMGDRSFANCTALRTVNVTNPVAPTMDHLALTYTQKEIIENEEKDVTHDSDIFYGSQPNQIEVVFTDEMKTGDDASGYKTYRANAHFMNVMKRTMSDAATAYEVPAQFGADVTLSRTIGAGKWNTLVLPFGLSDNAGRTDHTANVLKTALGEGGKVAMYRGLNKDRNTFLFLLYEDGNAIKPFLPVIVYTNTDVSTLLFEDVDVNYSGVAESNKVATATLDGAAGSAYGAYNGDRDTDMEATELGYFDGTDKTAYRFAGTFKTIYSVGYENAKVTAAEKSKIIGAGDFIIQNNKFYEVTNPSADRRYTLKAFRGWFQKIPEAPSGAKVATVEIAAFDGLDFGGETTEIVNVDLATGEEIKPQDIYSTDGRLVKRGATSTDGLAKGIYIIGGRKIVVK